jgi:hypothetical protein
VSEDRRPVWDAAVAVVGALWILLTGTCTWKFGQSGPYRAMWPLGMAAVAVGLVPLVTGLRALVPGRRLVPWLVAGGVAWLLMISSPLADELKSPGGPNIQNLWLGGVFLLVLFGAPGWLLILCGFRHARSRTVGDG